MSDEEKTVKVGGYGALTKDDAAALLPIVEWMRINSLNDQKMISDLYDSLQRENDQLRAENRTLRRDAMRYWAIRDALTGPEVCE